MSVNAYVFLRESRVPAAGRWQAALQTRGYDLQFDPAFDPRNNESPAIAIYEGIPFELVLNCETVTEPLPSYLSDAQPLQGRNVLFDFKVSGGDLRSMNVSMIVAAVLAGDFDGILFLPEADVRATGAEAIAMAEEVRKLRGRALQI